MKKAVILFGFSLAYGLLFSLGSECMLSLLGISMALSLDGGIINQYPRFIPFCMLAGLLALAATVILFIYHLRTAEKLGFTKGLWYVQFLSAVAVSIPMIELWERLFAFLRETF
ncbi:MAG: hypothetical protein IJ325_04915 [Clostridia bacterium]|nr:hypothetical protein [Clostridia bacterium]